MEEMPKNEAPLSAGIQIRGTFDIALARQHLRKLSEELQWSPTFRMRAITAFTALAELAHFKDRQHEGWHRQQAESAAGHHAVER